MEELVIMTKSTFKELIKEALLEFSEKLPAYRSDREINKPGILYSTFELSKYLGVSYTTAQKYKKLGCPFISNDHRTIYSIKDVERWLLENPDIKTYR